MELAVGQIIVTDLMQFDIDAIMHSGQVFRYFEIDNGYKVVSGSNYARVKKCENKIIIECDNEKYFRNYFDLDTDYNQMKKELSKYKSIEKILREPNVGGIRILRAEFIEMVISFIISANNNIKRFTKTLNAMCEKFGSKLECGLHAFPTIQQLSEITVADFDALGCGYRSKYLVTVVQQLKSAEMQTEVLKSLNNIELSKRLQTLSGVGPKVASCIMLFCGDFHRLDIAPQDTWIIKALEQFPKIDREVLLDHKFAGVAQQYVYYYLQYLHMSIILE